MSVLVIDASVVVDFVLHLPPHADTIGEQLRAHPVWAAPHLLDAEVPSVLRGRVLRGRMTSAGAMHALEAFLEMPVERYPQTLLVPRAFELRDNATFYDALYLALAEALGAPLLTRDRALAQVPGVAAQVEVVA